MSAQKIESNSFAFHTNPDGTPRFTVDFRQYCDKSAELLAQKPMLRTLPFADLYPMIASHIAKSHGVNWEKESTRALVRDVDQTAPAPAQEHGDQGRER